MILRILSILRICLEEQLLMKYDLIKHLVLLNIKKKMKIFFLDKKITNHNYIAIHKEAKINSDVVSENQ